MVGNVAMASQEASLKDVQVYFTKEVRAALNLHAEAILRYGVYDYPVQLYRVHNRIASVVAEPGGFLRRAVTVTEDRSIALRVKTDGRGAFNGRPSVMLYGTLHSITEHQHQEGSSHHVLTEISFIMDDVAFLDVANSLQPVIDSAAFFYQDLEDFQPKELVEANVADHLIALRFSAVVLADMTIRILPKQFCKDGLSFLILNHAPQLGDVVQLKLVLLPHHSSVELQCEIVEVSSQSDGLSLVRTKMVQRPPISYLLFLSKI
jgi:hypothetical protein